MLHQQKSCVFPEICIENRNFNLHDKRILYEKFEISANDFQRAMRYNW